jgi:hypothetical protein
VHEFEPEPTRNTEARRCAGRNKAGEPCRARPLHDGDYCLAHDEERRVAAGFGGAIRTPDPKPLEVLRERVENEVETWLAPYRQAVTSAVLNATYEGEVIASSVPDLGARISAAEKVFDRIYGRPKQVSEVSHSGGLSIEALFVQDPLAGTHTDLPEEAS